MNELRDKARRAFYAIKQQCPKEIPIRIWLKILESVIEPIALYGSEVWGPLTNLSQCYLSLKREYSMAEYLFTVSDKKLRSTLTRCKIVFTLWSESDGNRIALPNRMLQIHRYTDSVLRQNTADPSHIYNSSRPGETSVSALRTQDLLCVCCSIWVSLPP